MKVIGQKYIFKTNDTRLKMYSGKIVKINSKLKKSEVDEEVGTMYNVSLVTAVYEVGKDVRFQVFEDELIDTVFVQDLMDIYNLIKSDCIGLTDTVSLSTIKDVFIKYGCVKEEFDK